MSLTVIQCTNYCNVANTLLTIGIHEGAFIYQTTSSPAYLVLSDCPLQNSQLLSLSQNIPQHKSDKTKTTKQTSQICSSIKIEQLDLAPEPYVYLAQFISNFKYPYHNVKQITDPYGVSLLVFY